MVRNIKESSVFVYARFFCNSSPPHGLSQTEKSVILRVLPFLGAFLRNPELHFAQKPRPNPRLIGRGRKFKLVSQCIVNLDLKAIVPFLESRPDGEGPGRRYPCSCILAVDIDASRGDNLTKVQQYLLAARV